MECPPHRRRYCATWGGLQAHRCRSHGFVNPARDVVTGRSCPACGRLFRTRPQAIDHLAYRSRSCWQQLQAGVLTPASLAERQAADAADAAEARVCGWASIRGCAGRAGPVPPLEQAALLPAAEV